MDRCSTEAGSALVLAMMATALVVALGSALTLVAITETAVAASFVRGQETAYLADAAVARATVELDAIADWSAVLSGAASSSLTDRTADGIRAAGGVEVDLSAATASLARSTASRPFGGNNPRWRLFVWGAAERFTSGSPGYVAVWVADDPEEQDDDPMTDGGSEAGRGVLLLSAHAFGPGGIRRTVEAVVTRTPSHRARVMVQRPVR